MASAEHHMPDENVSKHTLFSVGRSNGQAQPAAVDMIPHCRINGSTLPPNQSGKRRNQRTDSLIGTVCQWTVEHQVGLSVNLLLLHVMAHICFPRIRQSTRRFYQLSYYNPDTGKYAAGSDDFYMVLYSIIVLTGLRAFTLDYVLAPAAGLLGITKKKDKIRFAEQGWVLIYDTTFWSLGMYIMYNHEHWLNVRELWTGWPKRELEGTMKWYYLVQFSFWLQQIVIVHIEEKRKDHWQMLSHHVVTCVLMLASYGYHQTKVGNMILCLMDVVDLFFALAKILKYLGFRLACDIAFGVFMLVWFVTRHVLYLRVVYSLYDISPQEINYGCYSGSPQNVTGPIPTADDYWHLVDPFRRPDGLVCWNDNVKWAYIITLLILQVLMVVWFGMIVKVAIKVLRGGEAEDSRSDAEEEDGEEDAGEVEESKNEKTDFAKKPIEYEPVEEEVGVEDIRLHSQRSSPVKRFRKGGGVATGVAFPSDRKELLGRIGCDGGHE